MNGFVVMACCTMDDFPVALCATKAEAMTHAVLNPFVPERCEVLRKMDASQWVCNAIAEFKFGKLVDWQVVQPAGSSVGEPGQVANPQGLAECQSP